MTLLAARALGVLGGLLSACVSGGALFESVDTVLNPSGRGFVDRLGTALLVPFLPLVLLVLGYSIHAVVEAVRRNSGKTALRLGLVYGILSLMALVVWLDSEKRMQHLEAPLGFLLLTTPHIASFFLFRHVRKKSGQAG